MTDTQRANLSAVLDREGIDEPVAVLVAWLLEAHPESTDVQVKLMVDRAVDDALWRLSEDAREEPAK